MEKITELTLDATTIIMRNEDIAREKDRAINDILEKNSFSYLPNPSGPYHLRLAVEGTRLGFHIHNHSQELTNFQLALSPFRSLMKDYMLICESYVKAVETAIPSRIEAIDMGRRGVHNEGAERLQEAFGADIECDFETARRFFTLLAAFYRR